MITPVLPPDSVQTMFSALTGEISANIVPIMAIIGITAGIALGMGLFFAVAGQGKSPKLGGVKVYDKLGDLSPAGIRAFAKTHNEDGSRK